MQCPGRESIGGQKRCGGNTFAAGRLSGRSAELGPLPYRNRRTRHTGRSVCCAAPPCKPFSRHSSICAQLLQPMVELNYTGRVAFQGDGHAFGSETIGLSGEGLQRGINAWGQAALRTADRRPRRIDRQGYSAVPQNDPDFMRKYPFHADRMEERVLTGGCPRPPAQQPPTGQPAAARRLSRAVPVQHWVVWGQSAVRQQRRRWREMGRRLRAGAGCRESLQV